jgi:short-subunit dehydrogenase
MKRKLKEAVVVITGASSGIGRVTALEFARRGATVVLAARSEAVLRQLAAECEALGVTALAVPTDMGDERAVDELAQRTMETFGHLDVWVNNAAVMLFGRFEDIPADAFRRVIETNFFGYVNGARAALRCFRLQGNGVLINNASGYAAMGAPYITPYVASKFAVRGLSDSLRQEVILDPYDIDVVTVLPSSIDTPMFQRAANYTGRTPRPLQPVYDPQRVAKAIVRVARTPRREVFVGASARLGALMRAVAPWLFDRVNARAVDRKHFTEQPALPTEGNLRSPLPPEEERGGWQDGNGTHRWRKLALVSALLGGPAWLGWRLQRRSHGSFTRRLLADEGAA